MGAFYFCLLYTSTALSDEISGAEAEGVEIKTLMAPSRIEKDEEGNVKGI